VSHLYRCYILLYARSAKLSHSRNWRFWLCVPPSFYWYAPPAGQRRKTTRYNTSHPERPGREFLFYTHVNIYCYTPVHVVGLEAGLLPPLFLLTFNTESYTPTMSLPGLNCHIEHPHERATYSQVFLFLIDRVRLILTIRTIYSIII
jgi:hypothetical protein